MAKDYDPSSFRESGGYEAERADYPTAYRTETLHQPASREPAGRK